MGAIPTENIKNIKYKNNFFFFFGLGLGGVQGLAWASQVASRRVSVSPKPSARQTRRRTLAPEEGESKRPRHRRDDLARKPPLACNRFPAPSQLVTGPRVSAG